MPNWKKLIVSGSDANLNTLSITNSGSTDDTLLLTATEDSSTAAPVATFKRNSNSPGDSDYLGQLKFKGENDADQEVVYAKITAKVQDASDGSEDGLIEFANKKAGSNNITARLRSDKLQLINGTELEVDGQVSASSYIGDGSGLTGISTEIISSSTVSDTFSSATTHSISHTLGTKNLIVNVYDNNDDIFVPTRINTPNTSSVILYMDPATTGRVVIGKAGHIVSGSSLLDGTGVISGSAQFNDLSNTSASYAETSATSSRSVNKNTNSGSICFWQGSSSEYSALGSYDPNTVYFVV